MSEAGEDGFGARCEKSASILCFNARERECPFVYMCVFFIYVRLSNIVRACSAVSLAGREIKLAGCIFSSLFSFCFASRLMLSALCAGDETPLRYIAPLLPGVWLGSNRLVHPCAPGSRTFACRWTAERWQNVMEFQRKASLSHVNVPSRTGLDNWQYY